MKICMDYQPAVGQRAGIGRYTKMLAEGLSRQLTEAEQLRLFYCDFRRRVVVPTLSHVEPKAFYAMPGAVLQKAWVHLNFPPFDWISGGADVFHFTNFLARPLHRGRSVVSIHDMSFLRYPEFAEPKNLKYLTSNIHVSAKRADAIITISEFSKREIEEFLPEARGKVHVTYLGIGSQFGNVTAAQVAEVRQKLGLTRPFLLTVGTIEPRKNLAFLVDVFEHVAPEGIDLVIAGGAGWRCESILARMEQTRYPGQLHWVRYVPDELLPALYTAASLFVMPSHYEGFGFGPLEAMACGTPVLSSAGGSLPEVLGSAAVVESEMRAERWAEHVRTLFAETGAVREERRKAGKEQAARYTWQRTAEETLAIYRTVHAGGKA